MLASTEQPERSFSVTFQTVSNNYRGSFDAIKVALLIDLFLHPHDKVYAYTLESKGACPLPEFVMCLIAQYRGSREGIPLLYSEATPTCSLNATTPPSKDTTTPLLSPTQDTGVSSFSSPATLLTSTASSTTSSFYLSPTFHQSLHLNTSNSPSLHSLSDPLIAGTYAAVTRPAAKQKGYRVTVLYTDD